MAEQAAGPRFLVEIKKKKEVIFSVNIGVPTKEIALQWGEKWKTINNRDDDHRVVATEVHS